MFKDRQHTEESKKRMRESAIKRGSKSGEEAPNYGTVRTEESKKLMGAAMAKNTYLVTFPDGRTEEVKNLREFCREQGLTNANMVAVSKGRYSQHKGFKCSKMEKALPD